jgi:hypothetical protein
MRHTEENRCQEDGYDLTSQRGPNLQQSRNEKRSGQLFENSNANPHDWTKPEKENQWIIQQGLKKRREITGLTAGQKLRNGRLINKHECKEDRKQDQAMDEIPPE